MYSLTALHVDHIDCDDLIHRYVEHCSQDHHVVDRRHSCSVDPLVDCLRSCETKHLLHIPHSHTCSDTHTVDVLSGSDSVDHREIHHTAPPVCRQHRHTGGRSYCLFYYFSIRFILTYLP